eukprot:COSAG04_NODE_5266_length_1681_cov_0.845133_1_plen_62_part_10
MRGLERRPTAQDCLHSQSVQSILASWAEKHPSSWTRQSNQYECADSLSQAAPHLCDHGQLRS